MLEMYGPFSPSIEMRRACIARRARIDAAGKLYCESLIIKDDAVQVAILEIAEPAIDTAVEDIAEVVIEPRDSRTPLIKEIQVACARHFNVSRIDILSARRTAVVVWPRQIAMYLSKELTLRSYPDIGRHFGGRDHTTILHAFRKIEGLISVDPALSEQIQALKAELVA